MNATGTSDFRTALQAHLAAISARDIQAFAATVSRDPNVRVIGPKGTVTVGHSEIVAAHRAWFESRQAWTFEPTIVLCRNSDELGAALLDVRYREPSAEHRFFLTLVFVLEDASWKLLYDQNTPLD